jgi:hypothetical protein
MTKIIEFIEFNDDCFINLEEYKSENLIQKNNINTKGYICNKYNKDTTETYRVMRELHIDPITHIKVPSNLEFKFEYMWDPITGERTEKDPFGPFYFNCKDLVKNFYYNRLRMLWVDGEVVDGINYEGYYGDGINSGDDLIVPSRGISKHMHLFRLPIIDCYLEKDFDFSVITMGPLLNDQEIDSIQDTLDKYYKTLKSKSTKIKKQTLNLRILRDLYNKAINKTTPEKDARKAVDEIKKMVLLN